MSYTDSLINSQYSNAFAAFLKNDSKVSADKNKNNKSTASEKSILQSRYPTHQQQKRSTKIMALTGSTLGTVASLLYLAKAQKKNLFKINDILDLSYGVKEITIMGISSIVGGVALGCLADKKDDNVPKVKEGIFQTMNVLIPAICTDTLLNIVNFTKAKNSKIAKICAMGIGVTGGMLSASAIANFINDPNNNEKDREITAKDALANLDDAIGALILAKFPLVEKLQIQRILPIIFAWCGYRAGQSN